jgi:hypothetical protein
VVLRSQDLLIVLKSAAFGTGHRSSTAELANQIGISDAETHAGIQRAIHAQLLFELPSQRGARGRPNKSLAVNHKALVDLIVFGIRYVFVPERGKLTRGLPTARGAEPLRSVIIEAGPPPVWPDAHGEVRGESFTPLHPAAVGAARRDPKLYRLLALVDGIRGGSAREREVASDMFTAEVGIG